MSATIDLVVFDLGRVLIHICDDWTHACRLAGLPSPPAALPPTAQASLHELVCRSERGEIDLGHFAKSAAPLMGLDPHAVITMSNAYLLGPFAGIDALLSELRVAGVMTACLSNTNANHWRMVTDPTDANFLPLNLLNHTFASHLLGMRKPEQRIYEYVEQQTGTAPDRILFFDDLEENLIPARQRGWRGHRITPESNPVDQIRARLRDEHI